jgi:hypothetical protein
MASESGSLGDHSARPREDVEATAERARLEAATAKASYIAARAKGKAVPARVRRGAEVLFVEVQELERETGRAIAAHAAAGDDATATAAIAKLAEWTLRARQLGELLEPYAR